MSKRQPKKLSDQLRQAIDDSGLTRYRIAKLTSIDESALAKFYNGQQGLSLEALDRLAECLEITITSKRTAKPKER